MRKLFSLACLALCSMPSFAEVTSAAPGGFVVTQTVHVQAPRELAWRLLTGHVSEWWHPDHTYSGDSANLYIEPRPLGCFCERLDDDDAVVHLTVTLLQTPSLLRLTGGLGPLGLRGVNGNLVFILNEVDGGTRVDLTYAVGGYDPDGLDAIAPAVDAVLGEQLQRFKRLVELGSASADSDE
ncbi:MAG: SRPBCC family protein [Pseudomonadota bacterium]